MRRVAAGAILLTVLAACPQRPDPDPTTTAAPTSPPASPARALTIAYPFEPPTLDPYAPAGVSPATTDVLSLLMPRLFGSTRTGLAVVSETTVAAGPPFAVEVALDPSRTWSNGEPITTDDLIATWEHARPLVGRTRPYRLIRRIESLGPTRARIVFTERTSRWRELFSGPHGILPADGTVGIWEVSGGPYVLERRRPGLDLRFTAAPGERVAFDPVRVAFVPDATGALEAFRRGEVDALGPYHAPDWQRRAAEAGASVSSASGSWVELHVDEPRAVRRALWESLDLERIVEGLVQDEGSPIEWAHMPDRGSAARRLDGRTPDLTLAVESFDDLGAVVARAIKFEGAEAGFRIEVVGLPSERFWAELPPEGFDAALVRTTRAPTRARVERSARPIPLYERDLALSAREPGLQPWPGPEGVFALLAG